MKLLTFVALFLLALATYGQDLPSLSWKVTASKLTEDTYRLEFSTPVGNGWQLYAPDKEILEVPAAELTFSDSSISIDSSLTAKGDTKDFKNPVLDNQSFEVLENGAVFSTVVRFREGVPAKLLGTLKYTFGKGEELYPLESYNFEATLEGGVVANNRIRLEEFNIDKPLNNCGIQSSEKHTGLLTIFFLGFLGGLVALLTPCVFPMIPLTVSFFTKRATDSSKGMANAILYGLFIFLIYVAFSIPFHIIGKVSPTIYNDISTNITLNIAFFLVFIAFAISFFGYYEITLPSGLANSANARQGSNLIGIFFMALTLAIVSFSCTGPILGTLLVGTASEGAWPLTAGLSGFGLALGLPFALFAMFPKWLHSMPKSGGWLNTVKVVLGFIELALALKFFSNADLVAHWGILKREIFFGLWVIIGLGLFLYLMGWIHFPHDDRQARIHPARRIFALMVLGFSIYLVPGVTNTRMANLEVISGFPPPHCYSVYSNPVNCEETLKDYEAALKLAKEKNKPIMIDFTGWACVNCRKMEENVWTKPQVKKEMEKYILVSLYVDDKQKLPLNQQFVYTTKDSSERKIITVGDKWSTFQTENFVASSQPWYILLSPDEKLLTPPVGYTPDSEEFASWLRCGLEGFQKYTDNR